MKIGIVVLVMFALVGLAGPVAEAQLIGPLCITTSPHLWTGNTPGSGIYHMLFATATQGVLTILNGTGVLAMGFPVGDVPVLASGIISGNLISIQLQ